MPDGIGAVDADALKAALQQCTVATQKQMRLSFRDKRLPDITAWFQQMMPGDTEFKVIYDKHGRQGSYFKFSDVEEYEEVVESLEQQEDDIFASIEKGEYAKVMDVPFAPILVSPLSQTALHCLEPLHLGLVDVQREGGAVLQKFFVRQENL